MIVSIDGLDRHGGSLDKVHHCKVCFKADDVVMVREVPTFDPKVFHTKIVFCGDRHEHHAVETQVPLAEVLKLVGWAS